MSIITIYSIFNSDYNDYIDFCNNTVVADFIDTTSFETTLTTYVYNPIWLRYKDTPIKFSNDEKGQDAFLRNFYNQLSEVVFDFHNYAKENIEYFLYQNDVTKQGKPMSKTITSGIAPINQTIDQEVDSTNLASGTGSQFVSETVYNGVAWHKLVEGYFTPNRKTALLKAFQWLFISVYSPETKYNDKIEQVRYVQLSFLDEDNNIIDEQKVYPTKSYFTMSEVDIQRPLMLDPQNIKKDVDIAGIVGTYEPNIYPRIYDVLRLDFPDGFIVYNTPSGYDGIEGVTISIPSSAVAENIKQGVNIGGIIGTYVGGVDNLEKRINNNNGATPYSYENNNITSINRNAFYYDSNIIEFKSNTITNIEQGAFAYCNHLIEVDCPNVLSIVQETFRSDTNLTTVKLPSLKDITGTSSYTNNFADCTSLTTVDLTSLETIKGTGTFIRCYALTTISLPALISLSSNAESTFASCTSLISAYLPVLTGSTRTNCFAGCTNLQTVNLGFASTVANYTFNGCPALTDVTLRKTGTVVTMSNVNAFASATSSNPVTIHVPSDLITSYQTATNWSTLYNDGKITFVSI